MESLTYHYLFNLSLMIALFYVFYILTENLRMVNSNLPAILYYSSALILSFVFSYRLSDEFIIDMRFVPFLIGSLYHPLSPLLGLLAIIIRGVHGIDEGFYVNILKFSIASLFLWMWRPYFLKYSPAVKMTLTFFVTLIYSAFSLLLLHNWIPDGQVLDIWFATIMIPSLSALILSFLIELIRENDVNERQIVKEERQKAIEEMGAAISHDIRNPLTAAIGFTELLAAESLDHSSRKHYTSILRTEIERAEQVIQNYLNYTKPSILSFSPVQVNEEMKKIIQMIQPLANFHSVQIETHFKSESVILVDRHKFVDSIAEFIRHSLLSTGQGGILHVSSTNSGTKVTVRIEVRDAPIFPNDYTVSFGDQSALLSASQTLKAMKGSIESKNSPFSHVIIITFRKSQNSYI